MSDINKLSNDQLDVIRETLKSEGPISETPLLPGVDIAPSSITVKPRLPADSDLYFGYDYFKRDINFFDNVPTPPDFKLGPGDEIILSLWGETNSRDNFTINKDGLIYYENIGFLNLSNKTLKEAELMLAEELSRVYSTLKDKDNPTKLMLELGRIKSSNVYFSGQIQIPGISLIHPFSDIFLAIVQAGGVKKEGSLRKVQLIRNNKVISTVDFYSFFTDGKNNFSSIKILDGDVIHIPIVSKRVRIEGAVNNPGYFELLNDESLTDLIEYAGSLQVNASSEIVLDRLIPLTERSSDDNAKISFSVNLEAASDTKLNNGDLISISPIGDVITKVEILGRVKSPGLYPSTLNLKESLDLAGGFNDPLFRQSIRDDEILVLRQDSNQFYASEFKISYDKSDKFNLLANDKIFVYENVNYDNNFIVTVNGEVNKKGSYQYKSGMTVQDAIDTAEGFTALANTSGIIVNQVFTSIDDGGVISRIVNQVNDVSLDYQISSTATINILPIENVVNIEGNVYNPGLVAYDGRKSIKEYIKLAGGMKKNSVVNDIYLKRANGKIKNISRLNGMYISAREGDTIFVPVNPDPPRFDPAAFTADIIAILTNLATIIFIIDNNSN